MPRNKIPRQLAFNPSVYYFKPQGVPLRLLDEVVISADELEALKLYEVDELSQIAAAKKMMVSQPTFARILNQANKKIAKALIWGKAIRIEEETQTVEK
ncbi:MAG: DUF134 domain-containing protein [Patescibacteria group bacterium]